MITRRIWWWLFVCVALGAVAWQQRQEAACHAPILYRIGHLDPQFGLTENEVRAALADAERLWEKALGRNLFEHSYAAKLAVNLVFDERQHATHAKQRLLPRLHQTEASHANVAQSYDTWRRLYTDKMQAYEAARTAHQTQAQAYNAQVQQWNAQGAAPRQVQQRLTAEQVNLDAARTRLQADEGELREMVVTLQALEERGKTLADTYTRQVQSYNALYGESRQFHKGEYNGKDITIYQYHDTADFTLVLAHELGHALGIDHVDDPKAVMHAFLAEQDLDTLALGPADIRALTTACGPP
jgi:predicted Zn-dependent protease